MLFERRDRDTYDDVAEARQSAAASSSMSQEAADLLAQRSTSNSTDSTAATSNSAVAALPVLQVDGAERYTPAAGSQQTKSSSYEPYSAAREGKEQGAADNFGYSGWRNAYDSLSQSVRDVGTIVFGASATRVSDVQTSLRNVDQAQIADGLNQRLLEPFQLTTASTVQFNQGVSNLYNWLDRQIPRDGTMATEDRRTALLVQLSYADARSRSNDPSRWEDTAYDSLFQIRNGMYHSRESLPQGLRGRENDPDIAGAEHYFETSRMVTNTPLIPANDAAGVVEVVNTGYGILGRVEQAVRDTINQISPGAVDPFDSSAPGEHRGGWEAAGMQRGVSRAIDPTVSPGYNAAGLRVSDGSDTTGATSGEGGSERVISMAAVSVDNPYSGTTNSTDTTSTPVASGTSAPVDTTETPSTGAGSSGLDNSQGWGMTIDPVTGMPSYGSVFSYDTGGYDPYTGLQNNSSTSITYGYTSPTSDTYSSNSTGYSSTSFDFGTTNSAGSSFDSNTPSYGGSSFDTAPSYGEGGFSWDGGGG